MRALDEHMTRLRELRERIDESRALQEDGQKPAADEGGDGSNDRRRLGRPSMVMQAKPEALEAAHTLMVAAGVISVWRGVWNLWDTLVFPDDDVASASASLLVGCAILGLTGELVRDW